MQVHAPYLSAMFVETLLLWYVAIVSSNNRFSHSHIQDKKIAIRAIVYWEWLAWRSNQRETSDVYYDKAFERVLHFVYVKAVKEEIQDLVEIVKTISH